MTEVSRTKAGSSTNDTQVCTTVTRLCHKKLIGAIIIIDVHTCVWIMFKCISMQNLIKIYLAVQEL